jgi:DNA repair protein RadC
MNFSIKHWPEQERPRERLLLQGASSLSDAELLAIFLRSGSQQHSAVELARILLTHFGHLAPIFDATQNELCQFHGVGASKYSQLMAVKELGRRYVMTHLNAESFGLNNSQRLIDYLRFELQAEKQEVFAVLCLDAHLRKIAFKKLFFGALNHCDISLNQLLRYVIGQNTTHLVIAHNHPLGKAYASAADLALTQNIQHALNLVEIHLIDHCIIASEGHFSFAEHQLIQPVNSHSSKD